MLSQGLEQFGVDPVPTMGHSIPASLSLKWAAHHSSEVLEHVQDLLP